MAISPELDFNTFLCNTTEYWKKLGDDIVFKYDAFLKFLEQDDFLLNNPIFAASLSKMVGSAFTIVSDTLIDAVETQLDSALGSLSDIVKDVAGLIAAAMTFDAQMKLAMYTLLITTLELKLEKRMSTLSEISLLLGEVDRFLAGWDLGNLKEAQRAKLEEAERLVNRAAGQLNRAQRILREQGKNPLQPFLTASGQIASAAKALETRPHFEDIEIIKYYQDWWKRKQNEFVLFADNSLKIMQALPADQVVMNRLLGSWDAVSRLTTSYLAVEKVTSGGNAFDLEWFSETGKNLFGQEHLVPLNTQVRDMVEEIAELEVTWDRMAEVAKTEDGFIEKWKKELESIHDNMIDTLKKDDGELVLTAKNGVFLMQLNALQLGMKATTPTLQVFQDILTDFDQVREVVNICKVYPEDNGDHLAEKAADLILKSYEKIFLGFAGASSIREARTQIGDIQRMITKSLVEDGRLLAACKRFSIMDDFLVSEALKLFGAYNNSIQEALSIVGKVEIAASLAAYHFSAASISLAAASIPELSWPSWPLSLCGKEYYEGEDPVPAVEGDLNQGMAGIAKAKSSLYLATSNYHSDPIKAEGELLPGAGYWNEKLP